MKIEAVTRFNGRAPGDKFEASKEDGEKWIEMGLAKKPGEKEAKGPEGPPENKAMKEPDKKK